VDNKTYWQLVGLTSGVFMMFLVVSWVSFRAGQATITPEVSVKAPITVEATQVTVDVPKVPPPEVKVTVQAPEVNIHNDVPSQPSPVVNVHLGNEEVKPEVPADKESSKPSTKATSKAAVVPRISVHQAEERGEFGKLLPKPKDVP
jgi:hypothetical protein